MSNKSQTQSILSNPFSLLFWAVSIAIMSIFLAFELLPLPAKVPAVKSAEFVQENTAGTGHEVSLPDNWRSYPGRAPGPGKYRVGFVSPENADDQAVYIPNYSGRIVVRLNGLELTQGGFISGRLIPDQGAPFFAPIPAGAVEAGACVLEITLYPGGKLVGFLSDVYIGPAKLLKGSYDWHYARAILVPTLVVFWQFLLASLLILLWYNRRKERAALICAGLLAFSCLHGIPIYLPSQTVLADTVAMFGLVANFWLSVLGLFFVYEISERKLPVREFWLCVPPALASLAFLVLPPDLFSYVDMFLVLPFSLVLTTWIVFVLIRSALWEKSWEARAIAISILGACSLVVHDTLVITNVTPDRNFLHFRIVYILILPTLSIVFLQRFIDSMNHADRLSGTIEDTINRKERQLTESFERRNLLEGQRAREEERQRIMRDMHDGLGGQLMSIIAMTGNKDASLEAIEGSARAALDDLRTMINSLAVGDDISGILGTYRERLEPQLAVEGFELEWNMIEIPQIEGLTSTIALNVLRIMQEAVTNAVKHSGGDKITIGFELTSGASRMLNVVIEDNGKGLAGVSDSGLGKNNMMSRIQALNGTLDFRSTDRGGRVCFSIPTSYESQVNRI